LSAALETLLDSIADAINRQEVPRILELNGFGDLENPPQFKADEVETPDLTQLSTLLKTMSEIGLDVKDPQIEAFLRKIASLPANDPEILKLKKELYKDSIKNPPPTPQELMMQQQQQEENSSQDAENNPDKNEEDPNKKEPDKSNKLQEDNNGTKH
jgi:phage gp29-like protein